MDTGKVYYDSENNECSIWQIVRREPEWAAARVQEGERALEAAAVKDAEIERLRAALVEVVKCGSLYCAQQVAGAALRQEN